MIRSNSELMAGQFEYNWNHRHGSLEGKMPVDRIRKVSETTPLAQQVEGAYDETKGRIRHREWQVDKTRVEHHRRVLDLVALVEAREF